MQSVVSRKLQGSCPQERLCPVGPRPGQGGPAFTVRLFWVVTTPYWAFPTASLPCAQLSGMSTGHTKGSECTSLGRGVQRLLRWGIR